MRGTGIGERLRVLSPLLPWPVALVHPRVAVETKRAYALFDGHKEHGTIDVDAVEAAIEKDDFEALTDAMGNTFEELVMPDVPQVAQCRDRLASLGLQPLMAGSGPTVFALVPPTREEEVRRQVMTWADVDTYMTTIVKRGDGER